MPNSKVFISELRDNTAVETVFLVASKSVRETRNGDPYLCITLQDRSGTIEARGWDEAEKLERRFEVDDFIAVRGRVSSYREELQITVADIEKVADDDVHLGDFLPHSRWEGPEMLADLRDLVDRHVGSDEVRRFLNALFDDESWQNAYVRAPAAVSNHHAYLAGLVEHSLSMARLAVTMGRHYNTYYPEMVDTDLLVAGCIIHDMAKVVELDYRRSFDYSTEGRLVGHVARGAELIGDVAQSLDPPLDDHLVLQLKHLVLSHHGKKEFGAPVTPKSPEAMLLHHLDMIDSRMNMCWNACKEAIEDREGGEAWSDYQRNFGGSLYIGGQAASGWKDRCDDEDEAAAPGVDPGRIGDSSKVDDPSSSAPRDEASTAQASEDTAPNLELFGDESA